MAELRLLEATTSGDESMTPEPPGPVPRPVATSLPAQWVPDLATALGDAWDLAAVLDDLRQDPIWSIHGGDGLILRNMLMTSAESRGSTGFSIVASLHFVGTETEGTQTFRQVVAARLQGGTEVVRWEHGELGSSMASSYGGPYLIDDTAAQAHAAHIQDSDLQAIQFYRTSLASDLTSAYMVYYTDAGTQTHSLAGDYPLTRA